MRTIVVILLLIVGAQHSSLRAQSSSPEFLIDEFLMQLDLGEDSIHTVYKWIAENISYDYVAYRKGWQQEKLEDRLSYILDNRTGVCQHYADLLVESAKRMGYESYLISGCSLLDDETFQSDSSSHAWVAIKQNDIWSFYDPTWDSPQLRSNSKKAESGLDFYHLTALEMNKTHKPFLDFWSDTELQENERDDAVHAFALMDDLEKTEYLISNFNSDSSACAMSSLRYYRSLLINLRYNRAIDIYNSARIKFQRYFKDKQRYFKKPKRSDEYLTGLMDEIYNAKEDIRIILNEPDIRRLAQSIDNDFYQIFASFEEHVNKENAFIELYMTKGALGRSMLLLHPPK